MAYFNYYLSIALKKVRTKGKRNVKLSLCVTNQELGHDDVWGEWMYRPTFS
jgi:hypothetical protein